MYIVGLAVGRGAGLAAGLVDWRASGRGLGKIVVGTSEGSFDTLGPLVGDCLVGESLGATEGLAAGT